MDFLVALSRALYFLKVNPRNPRQHRRAPIFNKRACYVQPTCTSSASFDPGLWSGLGEPPPLTRAANQTTSSCPGGPSRFKWRRICLSRSLFFDVPPAISKPRLSTSCISSVRKFRALFHVNRANTSRP